MLLGISLDPENYFGSSGIAKEQVLGGNDFEGADVALRPSTAYMMLQLARIAASSPTSASQLAAAEAGGGGGAGGGGRACGGGGSGGGAATMPLPELLRATLPPTPLLSSFSLPKLTLPGSLGVVVDGCAGRGTIPLAAAAGSAGYGIAGEYDADSARLLERVFARQRAATADGLQWDARALPLRDGVADSYVTDLPFGLKCLSTKQIERLYAPIISEAARVLVPGLGILVALTSQRGPMLLKRALATGPWALAGFPPALHVNIGGLRCELVVARRLPISWSAVLGSSEGAQGGSSSTISKWPSPGLSGKALRKAQRRAQFGNPRNPNAHGERQTEK